LIAPRRYGKTSLLLETQNQLKAAGCLTAFVDVFRATSKRELAENIVSAVLANQHPAFSGLLQKAKKSISAAMASLEFKAVINDFEFILKFTESGAVSENDLLTEALEFPEKYAAKQNKRLVIFFDEFSDVPKLNGGTLLKKMRAAFQIHKHVCYFFAGSQESLMQTIFLDRRQPFYHFCSPHFLDVVPPETFGRYIKNTMQTQNISMGDKALEELLTKTQGHPYYTQFLCRLVLAQAKEKESGNITQDLVQEAYEELLMVQSPRFDELWAAFLDKKHYLPVLKDIALFNSPYRSSKNVARPNINRVVNALIQTGYIAKSSRGVYGIRDLLFKEYILRMQG
jgi:hypothetical protein